MKVTPRARILFHLLGDRRKASARVRGWWVGEELERRGYRTEYVVAESRGDYLRMLRKVFGADVVIFQKTYTRYDILLVRIAHLLGKRCYFDLDDAPSRIGSGVSWRNARRMMALCDWVMVGGERLARMAREETERVALVPSCVRLDNYRPHTGNRRQDPPCLGWIGNGAHYADDLLSILAPAVAELARRRPLRLRIVGGCGESRLHDSFGAIEGLDCEIIDEVDWDSASAVADAVEPFDIGLYPLNPGPFNDYKCGFKAVEYMALALPVIASDVAANSEIVRHGETGFLVGDPGGWQKAIEALLDDPGLAERMGRAGRARVEQHYSIERASERIEAIIAPVTDKERTSAGEA